MSKIKLNNYWYCEWCKEWWDCLWCKIMEKLIRERLNLKNYLLEDEELKLKISNIINNNTDKKRCWDCWCYADYNWIICKQCYIKYKINWNY